MKLLLSLCTLLLAFNPIGGEKAKEIAEVIGERANEALIYFGEYNVNMFQVISMNSM